MLSHKGVATDRGGERWGFTSTSIATSNDLISGRGLHLLDIIFSFAAATASTPGISCMGCATADSSGHGCVLDNDDGARRYAGRGFSRSRLVRNYNIGWEDSSGTWGLLPYAALSQTSCVIASATKVFYFGIRIEPHGEILVSCTGYREPGLTMLAKQTAHGPQLLRHHRQLPVAPTQKNCHCNWR